jgi:hypothetical protein
MSELFVALLHHPVYDKHRDVVTTSITSIDVHDIARSCRTYGVAAFYVVTPVDGLRGLARKILRHWQEGEGATYNPNRAEALGRVELERTLEGVEIDIENRCGRPPRLIATSARPLPRAESFASVSARLTESSADHPPHLLLLGTGWGLTDELIERCEVHLAPVSGKDGYNHLSVRAAAAILLDRLSGTR